MYHDIKEMLCRELEEITAKGELTAGTLDTVDKLTHAIKSIETIMAMEEGGYSREGGMSNRGGSSRGRSYDNGGGGTSGARGRGRYARRDSMGRYASYDGGYSYDEAKDDMISELRELMEDAPSEEIKREYKRFIAKIEEKMN